MLKVHPDFVTGRFVLASIYNRLGETEREKEQVRLYAAGYRDENAYLVPWAAAASLWSVGASDMVYAVLQHGVQLTGWIGEGDRLRMGASYELLASWCQEQEMVERAAAIYALAAEVYGKAAHEQRVAVYVRLGMLHYAQGQLEASTRAYESALALDEDRDVARINYGWNLYQLGRLQEAATQFERVLQMRDSSVAAFNLGLVYLELGRDEEAAVMYARAVERHGAEIARRMGSVDELRAAVERLGRGRHILGRHWPQEP
jgi:tetratricopeptide (TPR) repeat protein